MAPKKYYAVKCGRETGIFETWDKCKSLIDGYKGAIYKSFLTLSEAETYMGIEGGTKKTEAEEKFSDDTAIAYVDGSFNVKTNEFSSGAVLFYKGKHKTFSEKFNDKELSEMRNVAGEIMGSELVIKFCIEYGIKKLVIYHDYQGISCWATGEWKANKQGTKDYADFCKNARKHLDFTFRKVKGHSGDKYNDLADKLAKQALGIE